MGGTRGAASAASSSSGGGAGGGGGGGGRPGVRNLVTPNKSMGQNFLKNPMIVQVRNAHSSAIARTLFGLDGQYICDCERRPV